MSIALSLALIASAFLVPASVIYRPEYFLLALLSVIGVLSYGVQQAKHVKSEVIILLGLLFLASLSITIQVLVGKNFIFRDSMIIVRYGIYILALLAGTYIGLSIQRNGRVFFYAGYALAALSILISFFQYFNIANTNAYMVPIYRPTYENLITGESWRRIIGTIGNPNYWGLWLGFCFVTAAYYAVVLRKATAYVFSFALLLCIVMTGSRTSLIAAVLGFAFTLISVYRYNPALLRGKSKSLSLMLVVFGGLAVALILFFIRDYYSNQDRFSADNTKTLDLRVNHWLGFLSSMVENPIEILFGKGPSKDVGIRWGDNSYLLILRDYGIFSLAAYLYLLLTILRRLILAIKSFPLHKLHSPTIALGCLFVILIFDLAADGWFNVRITLPLLFFYSMILTYSQRRIWAAKR